jgi:hypothetical protein
MLFMGRSNALAKCYNIWSRIMSQYIKRNYLWFKNQWTYLILSLNTSIIASMYVCIERAHLILWDMNKKWLRLIY